jgi:hypothetical protein
VAHNPGQARKRKAIRKRIMKQLAVRFEGAKRTGAVVGLVLAAMCAASVKLLAQANAADTTAAPTAATPAPTTAPTPAPVAEGSVAAPPPSAPAKRSAAELEKLVEPIALHPDPLIAVVLTASVYPLEVVQAARFVKDTNNIAKLDEQPWDENVKAVARFPTMIAKMDADLTWTTQLGQAFLEQQKDVMDAIQSLRNKAQKAGTLQTTSQQVVVVTNVVQEKTVEQQVVVVTNTIVQIQPSNPQVIYVPSYPPTVYYPPPAYVYDPYAPLITFGMGMAVGAIIANNCDWDDGCVSHHSDVDVNVDRNVNRNVNRNRNTSGRPTPYSQNRTGAGNTTRAGNTKWQPDQSRLRNSGAPPSAQTREARGWGGAGAGGQASQWPGAGAGGARPSQLPAGGGAAGARPGQQPSRPTAGTQPSRTPGGGGGAGQGNWPGQRPTQQPSGSRQQAGAGARPTQSSSSFNRGSQGSSAFGGVNSGRSAQSFSNRGAASRGGGGGGRGGGGRGGGGGRR